MQRQPIQGCTNKGEHEVHLAQTFVVHTTGELGEPVVNAGKDTKADCIEDHIVEVGNYEISVAHMDIHRSCAEHDARNATENEVHQSTQHEQHGGRQTNLAAPQGAKPGEHLHASGYSNQHCCHDEDIAHPLRRTRIEHVMDPHNQPQERDHE